MTFPAVNGPQEPSVGPSRRNRLAVINALLADSRTRGVPREAFLLIVNELDFDRWTFVKLVVVQNGMGKRKGTARRALTRLVELGYLERRSHRNTPNAYRLAPAGRSQIGPTGPS